MPKSPSSYGAITLFVYTMLPERVIYIHSTSDLPVAPQAIAIYLPIKPLHKKMLH